MIDTELRSEILKKIKGNILQMHQHMNYALSLEGADVSIENMESALEKLHEIAEIIFPDVGEMKLSPK